MVPAESTIREQEKRMIAKVYADRLGPEADEDPTAEPDAGVEGEVAAVAAWFDALPAELRSYLDHEAETGRRAYGQA